MHPIIEKKARLGLYVSAWLVLGLLLAIVVQSYSTDRAFWQSLVEVTPWVLVLGFLSLPVWFICRVMPLNRARVFQTLVVVLAAAMATGALWTLGGQLWSSLLGQWDPVFQPRSSSEILIMVFLAVVLYLLVAAVHYLIMTFEESRAVERRAFEMKWLAQESELRALRTQIDPHFLFNSLNSISALIVRDGQAARRMLLLLADFFRQSLQLGSEKLITLEQEFDLCRRFLDIEQVRFGARLVIQVDLADEARATPVPPLCLQPLVENAVRHGIAHLVSGGRVDLSGRAQGPVTVIDIDNDRDDEHTSKPGTGIGIENVRRRLAALYGDRASIDAKRLGRRFAVRIVIPRGMR